MNNKVIMLTTLAVGAAALGGVFLFTASGSNEASLQNASNLNRSSSPLLASNFDPADYVPVERTAEREDIDTTGRTANSNQPEARGWEAMLERMSEFDADGDGILSEDERREMRRAMREEWMARHDLDGDGELSREERMAARQEMFEQSERGQELMRQFDLDGNGVLDEKEQAAMEEYQQQQRDERRANELAQYDTDGDGQLSRDERRVQRQEQQSRGGDMMRNAVNEFDADGDGVLSIEESREAYAVFQERREIDNFVREYDYDGNGSMGPADYDAFLSDYERGNREADVNGDGEVNSQDLTMFTDMVTRSRNRP